MFVSTHLITEFEGLIDEFTIIEQGRAILTMEADSARERFQKIRARFAEPLPLSVNLPGALDVRRDGRQIELLCNGASGDLVKLLRASHAEDVKCEALSLEEIFVASKTLSAVKS